MEISVNQIFCGAHHWSARHPYFYAVQSISESGKTAIVRRCKTRVVSHDGYGQNGSMVCETWKDLPVLDERCRNVRVQVKQYRNGGMYLSNKKLSIHLTKWNGTPEDFYTD